MQRTRRAARRTVTARGVLSVHVARDGEPPAVALADERLHDAASTTKLAVLGALLHSGVDLDARVAVHNDFASAIAGERYANDAAMDCDPEPWRRLGGSATLRWLAERMIVHSSNLATNLCLEHTGTDAVVEVWRLAGARRSATPRGIEDYVADRAGIHNHVSAADLVRLALWMPAGALALLAANVHRADLAAGLPAGTRFAFKNGWFAGLRHCAGVVEPPAAPRYAIAVCYSGPLANGDAADDPAARLLARISADVWARRDRLGDADVAWPDWTSYDEAVA